MKNPYGAKSDYDLCAKCGNYYEQHKNNSKWRFCPVGSYGEEFLLREVDKEKSITLTLEEIINQVNELISLGQDIVIMENDGNSSEKEYFDYARGKFVSYLRAGGLK